MATTLDNDGKAQEASGSTVNPALWNRVGSGNAEPTASAALLISRPGQAVLDTLFAADGLLRVPFDDFTRYRG
jgi:hypothetical protein